MKKANSPVVPVKKGLVIKPTIASVNAVLGKINLLAVAGSHCNCGCSCFID